MVASERRYCEIYYAAEGKKHQRRDGSYAVFQFHSMHEPSMLKSTSIVLDLPESVFRIGWILPLRVSCGMRSKIRTFQPRDLVSSLRVCRTWSFTLTPLLWMVYDDNHMICKATSELDDSSDNDDDENGDSSRSPAIPVEILRTQNRHFRYVSICCFLLIPLECTHLRELYLAGEEFSLHAGFSNSRLFSLILEFGGG